MQESNMLVSRCWNKFHFVSTDLLFIASKLSANSCSSFFMRVLSALFLMYVWVVFSCLLQRVPYHDRLFPGWLWHYKQLLDEIFVISRKIKVEVGVISRGRRLWLIALTETLVISLMLRMYKYCCHLCKGSVGIRPLLFHFSLFYPFLNTSMSVKNIPRRVVF